MLLVQAAIYLWPKEKNIVLKNMQNLGKSDTAGHARWQERNHVGNSGQVQVRVPFVKHLHFSHMVF